MSSVEKDLTQATAEFQVQSCRRLVQYHYLFHRAFLCEGDMKSYNGYSGMERQAKYDEYKRLCTQGEDPYKSIKSCQLCGCTNQALEPHSEDYGEPYKWGPPYEYAICSFCHHWIHARFAHPHDWDAFKAHVRRGGWGQEFAGSLERKSYKEDGRTVWPPMMVDGERRPQRNGLDWWEGLTTSAASMADSAARRPDGLNREIWTYEKLDAFGREKLSNSFYMRDFLYSEIANFYQIRNVPVAPELALEAGLALCSSLLEPMNATFGRIEIRSGYRSPTVNDFGHQSKLNCASNAKNFARHIWDVRDANGLIGATACVVVPWFEEHKKNCGSDWRAMACWIDDHLPHSGLEFFASGAFNISWHQDGRRHVRSYAEPKSFLELESLSKDERASFYRGFPEPNGT